MPIQPTYPNVYIQEEPGGVRTISGVATSITAFIGWAIKGPVNEPTTLTSFGDYERNFGGLSDYSTMSYAVRDFYLNGGRLAIIVRVTPPDAGKAKIHLRIPDSPPNSFLNLEAINEGKWGESICVSVNHYADDPSAPPASPPDPDDRRKFNLIVYSNVDKKKVLNGITTEELNAFTVEEHLNVTLNKSDVRYLPRVLEQHSEWLRVEKSGKEWIVSDFKPAQTTGVEFAEGGCDGTDLQSNDYCGSEDNKTGIYSLLKADLFNLLCIPPSSRLTDTDPSVYQRALKLCVDKRAMLIVDPPFNWGNPAAKAVKNAINGLSALGLSGTNARNAALYFPRVMEPDPFCKGQTDTFVPCGIIAGIFSKTDTNRGVWKSPAGIDAAMIGIQGLQVNLTDHENGQLNPLGINCLRSFPVTGMVVWGARTLRGADQNADDYKYVAVRRTALYIEESLFRGTQWVVFEINDESLWAQIRLNSGNFMHDLFRQGAFQGVSPKEAYFVKCDKETTTQNDINQGIVNIWVGFAPLKPAEFIVLHIQQMAGQINQ